MSKVKKDKLKKEEDKKEKKLISKKKDKPVKKVTKQDKTKKEEKNKKKSSNIQTRRKRAIRKAGIKDRRFERKRERSKKKREYETRIVSIRRVAKVKAGGKRLRMSIMVVVGDKKGKVGIGLAKGKDVRDAQNKAISKAKKNMIEVPLKGRTIPHEITCKYKAAKIFLKPASPGTGVIAGDTIRAVVEIAGIKDILTKEIRTNNAISNVYATFKALKKLKSE